MKAVVFGAGKIGRGFLGLLLSEAGFQITFVDISKTQVALINREKTYPVYIVGGSGLDERVITDVRATLAKNSKRLIRDIVEADLILTAVGKKALSSVAKILAQGLETRLRIRSPSEAHVTIVACENVHDNTTYLRTELLKHVSTDVRSTILDALSFPNCMVDRIVPNLTDAKASPLAVWVEDYSRMAIDRNSLHEPFPRITGIEIVENLNAILEQKLWTLNMAHAIAGYFGWLAGYQFVHEATDNLHIKELLDGAFKEVGHLLCMRNPSISANEQKDFATTVLRRFGNTRLCDEIARVVCDPKRKLGRTERLIGPACLLAESNYSPSYLTAGAAAALSYRNTHDAEAVDLDQTLTRHGAQATIETVCGLTKEGKIARSISSHYLLRSL